MSIFSKVPTKPTGSMKKHFKPVNTASFDFGKIYPILCKNVMPGDTWKMSLSSFVRTMPLIAPVMHRNDIKIDAFFVPYRIIWKSSEEWFACNENVTRPKYHFDPDHVSSVDQTIYNRLFGPGSLVDYLGFGSPDADTLNDNGIPYSSRSVDAMPIRAYRMIYDYFFRNKAIEQDILHKFPDFYGDSDNLAPYGAFISQLDLQYRSWRRDIFTSALPDPQNGPDVVIPQADLDVESDGPINLTPPSESNSRVLYVNSSGNLIDSADRSMSYNSGLKVSPESIPTMRKLRAANLMEEFEEAMARIGYNSDINYSGKFKEWLRGIWNVRSSDGRLDIPEYLGGYRGPIAISEIPQTSGSTSDSPQGNLAGKGISAGGARLFRKKFFEEPGIMMVTMSIVPKSAYCQGDPREWLYESGFDYPNPYFEGLGEQEVKSAEINCLAPLLGDSIKQTFGYNVRNYEMKTMQDEVHGAFRGSLAFWHEARLFAWDDVPGLNVDFLKVHPDDVNRIFPSTEESDKLLGQFFFDIVVKRRLNPYGLPSFSNF